MSMTGAAKDVLRVAQTAGLAKDVIDLLTIKVTILDEKLAISQAELAAALEREETLKVDNLNLKTENNHLKEQLRNDDEPEVKFTKEALKILKMLFESGEGLTVESISHNLGISVGEARYHMDQLNDSGFLANAAAQPQPYRIGEIPTSLPAFNVNAAGRKFHVEQGN